jgi:hypothetical protein
VLDDDEAFVDDEDAEPYDDDEPFTTFSELEWHKQLSARGTRAWLVALGLAAAVRELATRESDAEPIPTPGLDDLVDRVTELATEVVNAADSVLTSAEHEAATRAVDEPNDPMPGPLRPPGWEEGLVVTPELLPAITPVLEAERLVRSLAQLALGVTAQAAGTDNVYRLERAAVEALAPSGEVLVRLSSDGFSSRARNRPELGVELAGLVSRLMLEWSGSLIVRAPNCPPIALEVDQFGTLRARLTSQTDGNANPLETLGWTHTWSCEWASPITLREPTELVLTTIFDAFGTESAAGVTVEIGDFDEVA